MASKITDPFDVNQDYYLCENCATHIALPTQLLNKYTQPENNNRYLLFEDLMNVKPNDRYFISNMKTTVQSTFCAKCSAELGYRFIALPEREDDIQEGRSIVYANKVVLWKGKKLLDAVSEEQLEQISGVTERLNLLFGATKLNLLSDVIEGQVEKKLLDGVTEEQEPVQNNMPEAVTEEQVENNMPEAVKEEQVEENVPEARTENSVDQTRIIGR